MYNACYFSHPENRFKSVGASSYKTDHHTHSPSLLHTDAHALSFERQGGMEMSRAQTHRSLPHVETNNSKLFASKVKKYDTKGERVLSDCSLLWGE